MLEIRNWLWYEKEIPRQVFFDGIVAMTQLSEQITKLMGTISITDEKIRFGIALLEKVS